MADFFDQAKRVTFEQVALATGAAAGTLLAGPGGGIAATIGITTALDWFKVISSRNDNALQAARLAELELQFSAFDDRVRKLEEHLIAKGKELDRPDFLTGERIFSDFAEAVTEARTPEKKRAIVNAAAHQFDPELGSMASRQHWLGLVRSLSDVEVNLIALLAHHGEISFFGSIYVFRDEIRTPLDIPEESDRLALESAAHKLNSGRYDALLTTTTRTYTDGQANTVYRMYVLSRAGATVARLIRDDE